MLRRFTVLIIISLFSLILAGCKGATINLPRTETEIHVDGTAADWDAIPRLWIEDLNASFALCRDDENLYLLVSTATRDSLPGFLARGITIWVDDEGKKRKQFGLMISPQRSHIGRPAGGFDGMPSMAEMRMRNMPDLDGKWGLMLNNGVNQSPSFIPNDPSSALYCTSSSLNNVRVLEVSIPISSTEISSFAIPQSSDKLRIGLEFSQVPEGMRPNMGKSGGRGGRGSGMGRGGGRGGPPGGKSPMDSMNSRTEWFMLELDE